MFDPMQNSLAAVVMASKAKEKCGKWPHPKWECTREEGHDGPCAMRPKGFWNRLYWWYLTRCCR